MTMGAHIVGQKCGTSALPVRSAGICRHRTRVDPNPLPVERQAATAWRRPARSAPWNRRAEALEILLDAERLAPEQVKHHTMSRNLVMG